MKIVQALEAMIPIGRLYVVVMFIFLLLVGIYLKFGWQHPMTLVSMIYEWLYYLLYSLLLSD